jgi:phosphate starvation-inducible PhoH-like protein
MLFKKQVKKIVITRPTVSKEEIGFLPGDLKEKMEPWMQPIYANLYQLYNKDKIDGVLKDQLEIVPLAFMRGRTFLDTFVIVDEAQNCTNENMSMIISRLGLRSKMVICGDTAQVDLKYKGESGFKFLLSVAKKVKDVESFTLLTNHRHPVVEAMLLQYEELEENTSYGRTNRSTAKV